MNEKEFNLQVLAKLVEIAKVIFAKLTISKEGTYTAAELWSGKNSLGENIFIDYNGTENEIHADEVDGFKFQVSPRDVFLRLWKFEKLCNVKHDKKCRFTFGEPEGEAIKEKAMYRNSKTGETITRKKSMIKVCDNIAFSLEKGQTNPIILYYLVGELWYQVGEAPDKETMKQRVELLKRKDFILNNLKRRPELMDEKNSYGAIFRTLYDVLCAEHIECKAEEGKPENEPEKAVICESGNIDTSANGFNKHESLKATEKRMREKRPDYIALIRYNGMYYSYEKSAKEIRLSDGVRDYITDPGDYICFPESLLDDVLPKLIKAGRGVLTCDIIENEPQQEDYPPEPYNKEKSENVASLATFKTRNVATSYERFQGRTICGRFQKNMRPNYLRQKVFPSKSFCVRSKIIRFKPRYFVGYTNYHLTKESALERKRIRNTSVYRALIRGET